MPALPRDYDLVEREGEIVPAVVHDGVVRMLASFPSLPGSFADVPTWSSANEVLPRHDWRQINLDDRYVPILDQLSYSSCTGQAVAGALMRMRAMMGQPFVLLSPTYPYALCNNGRDAGAIIGDVVRTVQERGTCLMEYFNQSQVYAREITPDIASQSVYHIQDYYRAETFDDICSGLTLGWCCVYALQVGGLWSVNQGSLDQDGCPPVYAGPGNHAMHAVGLSYSSRRGWMPLGVNSWGERWGRKGQYNATEQHFEVTRYTDAYLIRLPLFAPDDLVGPAVTDTTHLEVIG